MRKRISYLKKAYSNGEKIYLEQGKDINIIGTNVFCFVIPQKFLQKIKSTIMVEELNHNQYSDLIPTNISEIPNIKYLSSECIDGFQIVRYDCTDKYDTFLNKELVELFSKECMMYQDFNIPQHPVTFFEKGEFVGMIMPILIGDLEHSQSKTNTEMLKGSR